MRYPYIGTFAVSNRSMSFGSSLSRLRFHTSPTFAGLLALTAAVACGTDSPQEANDTDTTTGLTTSAPDESDTGGDSQVDSGSTGNACPEAQACGDVCCGDGEVCVDGTCRADCGENDPCGDLCCGDGEICYVGQCIEPGASCSAAICATAESSCGENEICDPTLSVCVPNFADPTCAFEPEVGIFDPVPRFTWGVRAQRSCDDGCQKEEVCNAQNFCEPTWNHVTIADDDEPNYHQVVMSPMVADIDTDCIPEIIFNSYQNQAFTSDGILRSIRGDTGEKVWSVLDPEYRTDPGSTPAVGDLDGDGRPEIVVPGEGSDLLVISGDGEPLFKTEEYSFGGRSGAPALVNFDGQGAPEIAFGRAVYTGGGTLIYEATTGGHGANGDGWGAISCAADLDGDGRPELVSGATAHQFTGVVGDDFAGEVMWEGSPNNGYCGIADFDLNGTPEVVTVLNAQIYVFHGMTGDLLASIAIPGGGSGGPPNIADFDGDGVPDIGTAGGDRYVVVQFDGVDTMTQLWEADTRDGSSQRTGSSVFDFDGDGRSEVIYGDEWYLRIYPGTEPGCPDGPDCNGVVTDDEVLFQDINSSRTRSEYPIIADVDGDFKAEVVVSTNNESPQGDIGDAGIEVFEDRLDNWVATLPIWNQHTYHVTNVEADGSIPLDEQPNWSTPQGNPYNSYRRNTQGELERLCAPDLVPSDLDVDEIQCPSLDISVRVVNQGCLGVGPGVSVAFYDAQAGLIGTALTQSAIPAGGSEVVTLQMPDLGSRPYTITVVVDDDGSGNGALNECVEANESDPLNVCNKVG